MTAAHVLPEMQRSDRPCPVARSPCPWGPIGPAHLTSPQLGFPFRIPECSIDEVLDVAVFHPTTDLRRKPGVHIVPVQFEWNIPPDGTQVAFTGFPFAARDPMTFRAGVAAYRPVWRDGKAMDEVVLDRSAWPGFSGSPVFLSDGRVIGMVIAGMLDEGTALTFFRPSPAWRAMLTKTASK